MTGEIIKMPSKETMETGGKPKIIELVEGDPQKPEPKILVKCELVGGEVKLTGDTTIIKDLQEEGIISQEGERVFPKDGSKFFNALRTNFRNPYLYARER